LSIEASAGTGKTYALAGLAVRFIAERGVRPAELLVVTFTRAATRELRDRIRHRLVEAAEHLRADRPAPDDVLLTHLARADRDVRRARIEQALAEFDAATIVTIHGFATQARGALGLTAGTDPDAELADDGGRLVADVCADVLAEAALDPEVPVAALDRDRLVAAVAWATGLADLVLAPSVDTPGLEPADRRFIELVEQARRRVLDRRRRTAALSFDDVLTELRDALRGPGRDAVIASFRGRYSTVLVDEFQDTDPVQWDIFSTLFGRPESGATLVLVADPKQAIYGFRGADVRTYLAAVADRDGVEHRSLATNWRSDGAVLAALEQLLDGATFGSDDIAFHPVQPAPAHRARRLHAADGSPRPAVSVRLALAPDLERTTRGAPQIRTPAAEQAVYGDLVARARELLDHARIPDGTPAGRPVRPSDIAVLVGANAEGREIQERLVAAGIPAVLARGGSVLESDAAAQWRRVLHAVALPSDPRRARAVALSWFGGCTAAWVGTADDDDIAALQDQLHRWAATLATDGAAAFVRRVWAETGVAARVLADPRGDRDVTDLDHVGDLLVRAGAEGRAGPTALLAALDERSTATDDELDGDITARRVESEARAVQIMTVHVAKGLEFPIVLLPTMWRRRDRRSTDRIYRETDDGPRLLDLAPTSPWPDARSSDERRRRVDRDEAGERMRLLYVALTRARHHTVVWWTRTNHNRGTALARVLFGRGRDGRLDPEQLGADRVALPPDDEALAALGPVLERAGGTIAAAVHGHVRPRPDRWVDPERSPDRPDLALARLTHVPDRSRHRWSFTAITTRAVDEGDPRDESLGDAGAGDEPTLDEPATSPGPVPAAPSVPDTTGPLAHLPAGAGFGTLVHAVLEAVDFASPQLDADLDAALGRELAVRPVDLTPVGLGGATAADGRRLLVAGLRAAIDTPLGPTFGDVRLRDIPRSDRLAELTFELRLGDGGTPAVVADIGRLLLDHLPDADPVRPWAAAVAGGSVDVRLAGHLTGSIDAVLRIAGPDGEPRFVVADYKSNRLHERGRPPAPDSYAPAGLARAMAEHHYPLQALLYAVAVHRYLRWRMPGPTPARHLGGVAYLFVRGMTGAAVARTAGGPDGVFAWPVPPAVVSALSDLLDGRLAGSARAVGS